MAERIMDLQSFVGGEADTLYRGPANSYARGENIEIRKNLDCITLSPAMEVLYTYDAHISYMGNIKIDGDDNLVVCLENGKLYVNGAGAGQLKHTFTGTYDTILGVFTNENASGIQKIYYITNTSNGTGEIWKSDANFTNFIKLDDLTTYGNATGFVGVINYSGYVYFAYNNKVFMIDKDEIITEMLVLPQLEEITGFTQFLGSFRIYANLGHTGIYYTWNGASQQPATRQEWENQPILGVVNDGAYDYAVLGFNENYSDLYLISGSQKQEIRVNLEDNNGSRTFNKYLSVREGIVYISGGRNGGNKGIFTYGKYFPGTNKSLVFSYTAGTIDCYFHTHIDTISYFAGEDDKVYKIDNNNPPTTYATSGFIETLVYEGGVWEELVLDRIFMAYKNNGGSIKIYARKSFASSDNYTLLKEITGSDTKAKISVNELIQASKELGTFGAIQYKIELIRGASNTTPELRRTTAWHTITNNYS